MGEALNQIQQCFLAISGQQVGPLSQEEIIQKILANEVSPEALIWYEGLEGWVPIHTIDFAEKAFQSLAPANTEVELSSEESPPQVEVPQSESQNDDTSLQKSEISEQKDLSVGNKNIDDESQEESEEILPLNKIATYADSETSIKMVFKPEEGTFSRPSFLTHRLKIFLISFSFLSLTAFLIFTFWSFIFPESANEELAPQIVSPVVTKNENPRLDLFNKIAGDIHTNPDSAISDIKRLIQENPSDEHAVNALELGMNYFGRVQRNPEAGRLLMLARKPGEAAKYFQMDPPNYLDAEKALFEAYQTAAEEKMKYLSLVQNILIILLKLNNPILALTRIQILVKEFPNYPNPFAYYLKSSEERAAKVFEKLSYHFLNSLLQFIETELPQIKLTGQPIVSLNKDKEGRLRIVGTYKGKVLLTKDHLPSVHFEFWYFNEHWSMVETNLTEERKKWSQQTRKKRLMETQSSEGMLNYLETTFRTQNKQPIHEIMVTSPDNIVALPENITERNSP